MPITLGRWDNDPGPVTVPGCAPPGQDGRMPDNATTPRGFSTDDLGSSLSEIMDHLDAGGWGQPPAVYALVPTSLLVERVPGVVADHDRSVFTPVEEECDDLDEFLATGIWPAAVAGAAVALEIVVTPPGPDDDGTPKYVVTETGDHRPDEDVARLVVGVLRNGPDLALLRLRSEPDEVPELRTHPQLALELRAALHETFAPDAPES